MPPPRRAPGDTQSRGRPPARPFQNPTPPTSTPSSSSSHPPSKPRTSAAQLVSSPPTCVPETLVFHTPPTRNGRFSRALFCALAASRTTLGPLFGPTRLQRPCDMCLLGRRCGASGASPLRRGTPLLIGPPLLAFTVACASSADRRVIQPGLRDVHISRPLLGLILALFGPRLGPLRPRLRRLRPRLARLGRLVSTLLNIYIHLLMYIHIYIY